MVCGEVEGGRVFDVMSILWCVACNGGVVVRVCAYSCSVGEYYPVSSDIYTSPAQI